MQLEPDLNKHEFRLYVFLSGFVVGFCVAASKMLLTDDTLRYSWMTVFMITGTVLVTGAALFGLWMDRHNFKNDAVILTILGLYGLVFFLILSARWGNE